MSHDFKLSTIMMAEGYGQMSSTAAPSAPVRKRKKAKENNETFLVQNVPAGDANLKVNWDAFILFFNNTLKANGSTLPPLKYLSKGMKSRIQRIVNQWKTKRALFDACVKLAKSNFLNGRVMAKGCTKRFNCSFMWLIETDEHFERVLTGYYDNPPEAEPTADELRRKAEEERAAEDARRREQARRIEEEERAERQRRREEAERNKATPEELKEIFARINKHMPPAANNGSYRTAGMVK